MLAETNHDKSKKKKVDRKTCHRMRDSTKPRYILTGLDDLLESTFMLAEIISNKKIEKLWPGISTRAKYMLTQLEFDVCTTSSRNDK